MCGKERTVTNVAEDHRCGDSDCYIDDMVNIGWKIEILRGFRQELHTLISDFILASWKIPSFLSAA